MSTSLEHTTDQNYGKSSLLSEEGYLDIKQYYDIAGPDYETWSRNFNMHFGYCKTFTDIFFLERMLINMNGEVLKQLQINPLENTRIADLVVA